MKFSAIIARALAAAALVGTASTATAAICDEHPGPTTAQTAVFPGAGSAATGGLNCGNATAFSSAAFLSGQKTITIRVTSAFAGIVATGRVFGFEQGNPNPVCQDSDGEDTGGDTSNCPSFTARWRSELDVTPG